IDPIAMLRPRRKITGLSAVLLPFTEAGGIDWRGFAAHLERTAAAGLIPAVNMDTGYVNLLDDAAKLAVLNRTQETLGSRPFAAGAFVGDQLGAPFNLEAYLRAMEPIVERGGTPVIFQSFGLTELPDAELIAAYASLGRHCNRFIAFELGTMFAPFGKIHSLDAYRGLLGIGECIGAKHSSLSRDLEWRRLQLRDELRPDFQVFTGNDLAIDMVMYGSDYLLGLSTFAPDLFAKRDHFWHTGDSRFHELNDVLQYLGFLAFREPVPAYKHSAAMFLKLRGWLDCDAPHPKSPRRPDSDRELLRRILEQLEAFR
ncbi:MAG TPA: dihydrodipicolinate synthase family protein, partial [Urbifossiella sp.]